MATAITRATILATIRFRGDCQNVRKFPSADLYKEMQTAFGQFYQLVEQCNEGWWDTQANVSTVASQAYIAAPADAWIVKAVDRMDGTTPVPLMKVGISQRNHFGTSTGKPVAYRMSARGLELYQTPGAIYTLRVTYAPLAPEIGDTAREYYTGWEDYVIEKTLLELAQREGKPLDVHMKKLGAIEAMVKAGASNRDGQEPDYLVLREYEGGGTSDEWKGG